MTRPATGIFARALRVDGDARAAFLDGACGGDGDLRREVEAMLVDAGRAEDFFGDEAGGNLVTTDLVPPVSEQAGDVLGPYKLLQQIGEGGFGVVWMAEQSRPILRKVALKVVKAGMDTKQVLARFEAERQALAMMDHPNIARVLDAGATPTGRPYFAMELVKGIPITEFCDQKKLDTRQRLELFCDVCSAVNHAHQKGVIHRDLKPSNVMVTLNGDHGVAKVIDFGIAKATEFKLTDKTLFTRFEQFLGTPVYMSPEQAAMSVADIDTRSDIYSLGMLLYELLAGRPAFDPKTLLSAGYDEMRRIIKEDEPPKPSVRLSTAVGEESTRLTVTHGADPKHLVHQLKGDLDWIVMKALEKDRARRYETANGLSADIRRFLHDEPVSAVAPSAGYKFRKLVRRNKAAFTAAALIATVLVVATGISTWQAIRATRAEQLAKQKVVEVAAERDAKDAALQATEAIATFLTNVFQSPDPARDPSTITVAETLGAAAKKVETDLASQPGRRAKLQSSLGRTFFALGLLPNAIPLQEKVRDYYRDTSGPEHPDTLDAMKELAIYYWRAGRNDEALQLLEEVLPLSRKVLGPEHPDTITAMHYLAHRYNQAGRYGEALRLSEVALTLSRKVSGPEHQGTLRAMTGLGESVGHTGRPEEALKMREESLALHRKVLGPQHPDTLFAMDFVAESYRDASRLDEAIKLMDEVVMVRRRVLGPQHPDTLDSMLVQAETYSLAGRTDEALNLMEEVLTLRRKLLGPEYPMTLNTMIELARSYGRAGRKDEAFKLRDEMLTVRKRTLALQAAAFPAIHATLVAPDAGWKWLHPTDGKDPAEALPGFHKAFPLPAFDDSKWTPGRDKGGLTGGFGYGDMFDGVDIGQPQDGAHRHTAYFRHAFTTDTEHAHLELRCERDDGIIAYLDGKEVVRNNVGPGDEAYLLFSIEAMGAANEGVVHRFPIPGPLAAGTHTLAISVHNTAQDSSDLYLGGVTLVEVDPTRDGK